MIINFARSAAAKLLSTGNTIHTGITGMHMHSIPTLLAVSRSFSYSRANFAKKTDFGGIASLGKAGKKKMGKLGPMMEKKVLPVEADAHKLVSYVCGSNILKEGQDVKLKPDEEYPEWLWSLRTGKPPSLEEMDPESKSYWRRVRTMAMRRNNQLAKLKKF